MSCVGQSLDPIVLRRVFLLATRDLFSDPKNYAEYSEELSRFVYNKDDKQCTLDVELDYLYNPAKLSSRHAVYVGIDDFSFNSSFLNSEIASTPDNSGTVFNTQTKTNLTVRCVSPLPDEALLLSTVTMGFFFGLRPKFMSELGLQRFDLVSLTKPAPVEKAPTALYMSAFIASLAFNFEITSYQEGLRIKTFNLDATGRQPS